MANNQGVARLSYLDAPPHAVPTSSRSGDSELGYSLWEELTEGRYVVQGATHSATHCELAVVRCPIERRPNSGLRRQFDYLRRMLIGETQKVVASAAERSVSTVAAASRHSLGLLGLDCGLLYVPYLLVRAAHVASGLALCPSEVTRADPGVVWRVRVERPELLLRAVLSKVEREVAGLIVEGYANDTIARRREVSVRTIANQISSIFRKLEVSGRNELLCALVRLEQAHFTPAHSLTMSDENVLQRRIRMVRMSSAATLSAHVADTQ